jgi:hypothetical protein
MLLRKLASYHPKSFQGKDSVKNNAETQTQLLVGQLKHEMVTICGRPPGQPMHSKRRLNPVFCQDRYE